MNNLNIRAEIQHKIENILIYCNILHFSVSFKSSRMIWREKAKSYTYSLVC